MSWSSVDACQVPVKFVDTDGDSVEFRVNSASGKLEIVFFDNGQSNVDEVTKCKRKGATIICNGAETTAPDEDTAKRVVELFQSCCSKARSQIFLKLIC